MSKRIIGVTVGTSMKPEKALVKASDLTEEQKAQVRANIGVVGTGKDGADGWSIDATSSAIDGGTRVTLYSIPPDDRPPEIRGMFEVKDGHTPVIGIDYWTEADKVLMVNDVLSALPTWTGGSY